MPDRVVARISRSGVITIAQKSIRSPSPCGLAAQVDSTMRSCIHRVVSLFSFVDIGAGFPARPGPHGATCSVKSGFEALAWNFEAADNAQAWLLSQRVPYASTWGTMWDWDAWPWREGRASPSSTCGGLLRVLLSIRVRRHHSLTSEIHRAYSITVSVRHL